MLSLISTDFHQVSDGDDDDNGDDGVGGGGDDDRYDDNDDEKNYFHKHISHFNPSSLRPFPRIVCSK